uniref:RxLR effector protein n=1 Tax=Phytophthora agathidicida TaxID=1642459 RepID=A0A7G4WI07_9STRA|nr:PaRXLR18 [Phytophthora agathidicida]
MRLSHLLVMTVAGFLASSGAFSAATDTTKLTKFPLSGHSVISSGGGRSLRLATEPKENEDVTEERIWTSVKLTFWECFGFSVKSVQKKLGMAGLEGEALKAHTNYPTLLKYADNIEKHWMRERAEGGFSTYSFWKKFGLDDITNLDGLTARRGTEGYRKYRRYVNEYDDNIESLTGSGYHKPSELIDKKASDMEKMARAQIWGERKRSDDHVREILGLVGKTGDKLTKSSNYKYYKYYLDVKRTTPLSTS